ncbi:sulfatase-like hydrolase/transferase [uncultured Paludibaculum sp.]|uniref:sulfatase family protein n=1 Tax=uncultured Paludibaculum sp. TaxID=1765020 RepID=UPI002AAA687D|nr:sulfatase-like hydrolase/transferase [uncultured Paludibaculum sp.]
MPQTSAHFTRRDALRLLGGASACSLMRGQARRPNFLVIVTDDHGIGDVGCYGHKEALTPNLDRLAASGVRFTQWYANAPVCSASRAAILTGKYPDRTGVKGALPSQPSFDVPGLRAGEVTFPALLKQAGYSTAAFGKWHLGSAMYSRPLAQGFDSFFGWYSGWLDAYSHRYYQLGSAPGKIFHDLWRNTEEVFEEPAYMTELLAREASAHLARQKKDQPFAMYLAFGAPHYSMMAPKKYLDRFPASMERDRRTHLGMVAAVDDAIGLLLNQLRQQGLEDDTVVFFQADNGATREVRASSTAQPYTGGSNGAYRGYKLGLFDGGMHVPAILRAPGFVKAGQVWDRPLMSMDLLPTFLSMAGQDARVPASVDGRDILPVLRGEKRTHEDMFWSFNQERAVRQGDWKLILNPPKFPGEETGAKMWLSNLEADPGEKRNMAGSEPERVRQLTEKIRAWERYVGIPSEGDPE